MIRLLLALAFLVLLAWPAHATVTCTASDFVHVNTGSAATTLVLTVTIPSQTYRRPVLTIMDYDDESTTISSVSGTGGGTWTPIAGAPDDMSTGATGRQWFYYQSSLGSTGSDTVTVTFSGSIRSAGTIGTCYSDTSSLDYVSSAAYTEYTASSTWTSASRTSTTTGVVIGDMMGTSGVCDISTVGTNQTEMTSPTASRRTQIITRPEASSGTYDITANLAFNCTGQIGAHLFEEAAAGGLPAGSLMMLQVGK